MGVKFAASSVTAGAPQIEGGIWDARFDGVEPKTIENSQFGNGDSFEWAFTLLAEGEPVYDEGEPVVVTGLTSRSMNTKSKTTPRAVKYLKAIMSPAEYAQFEAEEPIDAEALVGRNVQVIVEIKDSGWPKVADVLPAPTRRQSGEAKVKAKPSAA